MTRRGPCIVVMAPEVRSSQQTAPPPTLRDLGISKQESSAAFGCYQPWRD